MLASTHKLLSDRRKHFESVIKKYKNYKDGEKKERKIKEAIFGAREIAPYLRSFALIENLTSVLGIVIYGCDIHLLKNKEEKIVTILGQADVRYNPRYRNKERYLGYGDEKSLPYLGKREGDGIEGWEILKIERFFEE